jgi:hypothetical protein
MDTLQTELAELKGFIADLKTDRVNQKEKEKKESWTKFTSLSIVFLAVLAAIATQWSGKYGSRVLASLNDSTFQQAKASDQWSFYQAKSIKQNLYEISREPVAAQEVANSNSSAVKRQEDVAAKIAKYESEKKQIREEAEQFEKLRDKARKDASEASRLGSGMGSAVAMFQISIALGSICLLTKKKSLWYLSIAVGVIGAIRMAQVWM